MFKSIPLVQLLELYREGIDRSKSSFTDISSHITALYLERDALKIQLESCVKDQEAWKRTSQIASTRADEMQTLAENRLELLNSARKDRDEWRDRYQTQCAGSISQHQYILTLEREVNALKQENTSLLEAKAEQRDILEARMQHLKQLETRVKRLIESRDEYESRALGWRQMFLDLKSRWDLPS